MQIRHLTVLLAAVGFPLILNASVLAQQRVALVIGNAVYEHAPRLANPLNDAKDVGAALSRLGFSVTRLENVNYEEFRGGLQAFRRAASDAEVAVVFYAGHGIEVDQRNFLVPVDARLASVQDVEFETVSLALVTRSVARASGLRLVILDACRENPFAVSMQRSGATRAIGRGLARVEPAGETLVAYAARAGTVASDGYGRNSPYSQALLTHLKEPGVEVGFMFRKVRDAVLTSTGGRQEPFVYGSLPTEEVFLAEGPSPALSSAEEGGKSGRLSDRVTAEQLAAERLFWESVKDGTDPADLQAYLDRYPGGTYEVLARNRLKHAELAREPSASSPPAPIPESVESSLGLGIRERRLIQLGLLAEGHDPGPADGLFGRGTRGAIARWQASLGEAATGYVGVEAAKVLMALGRQRDAQQAARQDMATEDEGVRTEQQARQRVQREAHERGHWAPEAERVALVVGNGKYNEAAGALKNPVNDAAAVAAALRGLGFQVIEGRDLDEDRFYDKIAEFDVAARKAGMALFFYAGHGLQVEGRNYLMPVDLKLERKQDLKRGAVELADVLEVMRSETNLVILDACRNNPLAGELARSLGLSRAVAANRGLARVESTSGTLIAYATEPGAVAADGAGEHSPYTEALLAHLETPGLSVHDLFTQVTASVLARTDAKQKPWTHSSLSKIVRLVPEEKFVPTVDVSTSPESESVSQRLAAEKEAARRLAAEREMLFWETAKDSKNSADVQAYLDLYPKGLYAALARNRLKALQQSPTPTSEGTVKGKEGKLELSRADRRLIQHGLKAEGFDPGAPDGLFGRGTRAAIGRWQASRGEKATSYLDVEAAKLLLALGQQREEQESARQAAAEEERLKRERDARNQAAAEAERQRQRRQQEARERARREVEERERRRVEEGGRLPTADAPNCWEYESGNETRVACGQPDGTWHEVK